MLPAGIVFYDAGGSETGGIGLVTLPEVGERTMLIFDYANSEAIEFGIVEAEDGQRYEAGIEILDRVSLGANIEEVGSVGTSRIANEDRLAQLVIRDTKGRPRIRIYVSADDEPRIEMLDSEGAARSRVGYDGISIRARSC